MHGEDGTVVLFVAVFQLSIDEVKVRNRTGVIELESIGIQTNEFDGPAINEKLGSPKMAR